MPDRRIFGHLDVVVSSKCLFACVDGKEGGKDGWDQAKGQKWGS